MSRLTLGKRMGHGPKKDTVEEKLLEIIQEPECKPDEEELFCLSLAAKLRKIKDPKKRGICTAATAANTVQLYVR